MKIQFLVSFEGGNSWPVGSVHDIEDQEARRLIAAGFAVPVATVELETAATKPAREKRG